MKEKIGNVGGNSFWTIPVENGDGRTSVNNGISKVNFRRWEVEYGGDAKGDETEGLEV